MNPKAGLAVLRATADEATARAQTRTTVGKTIRWMAEIASIDAQRDTLLNHQKSLEQTLGPYVEPYCNEKELSVPQKGTVARMELLMRINAEMRALQAKGTEIACQSESLVQEEVRMQAATAKDKMQSRELPSQIESKQEANVLKESLWTEEVRHFTAILSGTPAGAVVGFVGGFYHGIQEAVCTWVNKDPKSVVLFGIGGAFSTFLTFRIIIPYLFTTAFNPAQLISTFVISTSLVIVDAAIITGVGAGLASRYGLKKEEKNPLQSRGFSNFL